MQPNKFNTVVDSAWGSSGKGAASARLADIYNVQNLSTNNYPNSGHSVVYDNDTIVFKALPSGAALKPFKNKSPTLWIGPASGFELDQIGKEISRTQTNGKNLIIHERAVIVTQDHKDAEAPGGNKSTLHISSTMSGSGAAFTDKAMRRNGITLAKDADMYGQDFTPNILSAYDFWKAIQASLKCGTFLHEVSQGFALSLNYGTHYPFCTFRDSTPQQAYADMGILPSQIGDVYLNVRSFPIRVGNNYDASGNQIGYSGDVMDDQKELTWEQVASDAGFPEAEAKILAEKERTTVTKKIRRVFTQSWKLLEYSAKFCGATKLVLNFPQYIDWNTHGMKGDKLSILPPKVQAFCHKMEDTTNLPVVMVGTGADHNDYVYTR